MQTQIKLYGIRESSERLGVSRATLRRLVSAGKLRSVRILRRVLIPSSELDRMTAQGCGEYVKAKQAQEIHV
jgi:excisionase family DNA binding protein